MTVRTMYRWWGGVAALLLATLLIAGCADKKDQKPTTPSADDTAEPADDESMEDESMEDESTEDESMEDESMEDETEQPALEGPATTEPAQEETMDEPATTEPATTEPATTEPATTEPATTEPAPAEPAPTEETTPAPQLTALEVTIPLGLPPLPVPDDNPMSVEKVALGKMLYFDKRLSKDGTVACATCHDPAKAWAEHTPTSTGIGDQVGGANSPTVMNAAYATAQFWDGRAATLEEQALGPIENPIEMGHNLAELVPQLNAIAGYKEQFQKVFQTDVTKEGIAKAIAAFERTVLVGNSPYDRFKAGDEAALTDIQKKGMELFDDIGCSTCHGGDMFSNYRYYNAGVGMAKDTPDPGRMAVTKEEKDLGKYRAPSLRNVADTAPYFHDGSCATLEEAVAMMAGGGIDNDNLSAVLKGIGTKEVPAEDQAALVEFLKSLSGDIPVIESPTLP